MTLCASNKFHDNANNNNNNNDTVQFRQIYYNQSFKNNSVYRNDVQQNLESAVSSHISSFEEAGKYSRGLGFYIRNWTN